MKFYSVAEIDITDQSWVADYLQNVTPMLERYGGRYLARTPRVEKIEGERAVPQICLIVEWPSREAIDAFYDSEEYRPWRERRVAGAKNEFLIVPGEDVARLAKIG
ncbi:MAG TPA: DUF1330 domain-containing protein [Thermoanaerobaculia bacterium]|jgi:uncharacterized protein (DUF1330 family)